MCDPSSKKSVSKRVLELDREDDDAIPTKIPKESAVVLAKDMPEKTTCGSSD